MKKLIAFKIFTVILLTGMYIQVYAQNDRQSKIISSVKKKYSSSNNGKMLVQCTAKNTTSIEIYRDAEAASVVNHSFYITIQDGVVIRHAGEYDGMCGVIDTYTVQAPFKFNWVLKKINQAKLYKSAGLKPNKARKGTTRINFYNGEKCWLSLYDSKDKLNVIGDFMNLVDQIVESTGGEPEFGGPLIPGPEPIIVDPDPDMDSNY
jgi:hypothetical protein